MESPIVTLTTDWGDREFFLAMVKGRLSTLIPDVRIFDLSHRQVWNDTLTTANIIRFGCMSFSEGSVHIVDIGFDQSQADGRNNTELQRSILALYKKHYFISSSLKLLELAFEEPCETAVCLPLPEGTASCTFVAHSQYCEVAKRILSGEPVDQMGEPLGAMTRRDYLRALFDGDHLESRVINIDSYGNANLNVTFEEFESVRAGRHFRVELLWHNGMNERCEAITSISRHYSDVRLGELLLTVSSTGHLQLAMNRDSAAKMIGLSCSSRCVFYFR